MLILRNQGRASTRDDFHLAVLESYVSLQNFDNMPFDVALRFVLTGRQAKLSRPAELTSRASLADSPDASKFLSSFRLPGEAQKIERIMEKFAATYTQRNPTVFQTPGARAGGHQEWVF